MLYPWVTILLFEIPIPMSALKTSYMSPALDVVAAVAVVFVVWTET